MGVFGTGSKRPPGGATHLHVQVERGGSVLGNSVSDKGSFRWGPSTGNELIYPVEGVKGSELLFHFGREGAELHVKPGMTGEISAGSSTLKVEDLGAFGLLRGSESDRHIIITEKMGGWIDFRGMKVFFTFGPAPVVVEKPTPAPVHEKISEEPKAERIAPAPEERKAPSIPPRVPPAKGEKPLDKRRKPIPPTPAHLRRARLGKEDRHFTYALGILYVVMVVFNVYLASIYKPEPPKIEKVPERFAKLLYEAPQTKTRVKKELEEKKKKEEAEQKESEAAAKVVEKVEVQPEVKKEAPAPEQGGPGGEPTAEQMAQRREAIRKEVSKKGLLGVLGGRGGAATASGRASVLSGGGRAADLDRILENVGGLKAGAGGGGDGTGGEWKGQSVGGASLDSEAARAAAASKRVANLEQRQDASVKSSETVQVEDISMKEAVAIINRTVETYLGGIRYLYNRELRKTPDLEGKVTIAITINPDGSVGGVSLVETTMNAPELVDGIIARIKRWTFPQVAQKAITVKYPFVFFPSM